MTSSQADEKQLIFLWMVPRSCSTVIAKCMTFVEDVQVWMEPYLGCYFNDTFYNPTYKPDNDGFNFYRKKMEESEETEELKTLRKKMKEIIEKSPGLIDQKDISWLWVKEQLEATDPKKKITFVKDEAAAILHNLEYLPERPARHTFIIRHPREVFASFRKMIRDRCYMTNEEVDHYKMGNITAMMPPQDFYPSIYKLWKHLREKSGEEPLIVDAYDLLTNTEEIVPKYFEKVGIPFKESYLQWESGNIFGKWNGSGDFALLETDTSVYTHAVKSGTFIRRRKEKGVPSDLEWELTADLMEAVDSALPYYEEMHKHRLC